MSTQRAPETIDRADLKGMQLAHTCPEVSLDLILKHDVDGLSESGIRRVDWQYMRFLCNHAILQPPCIFFPPSLVAHFWELTLSSLHPSFRLSFSLCMSP